MIIGLISRFIALIILIILFPLIFLISLILLIFQGRPIIFQQSRVGYDFNTFKIFKFRTMDKNNGPLITGKNDERITYLGRFLRKSKIDELPQLFNILKGDMRFIGPRPEIHKYFNDKQFQFLKNIKPGISDYSSIVLRDEDKILNYIGGEDAYEKLLPIKIKLANYYSKKKSFSLDLKLVAGTIITLFLPNYYSKTFLIPHLIKNIDDIEDFFDKYIY